MDGERRNETLDEDWWAEGILSQVVNFVLLLSLIVGVAGNAWVIRVTFNILKGGLRRSGGGQMLVYVVALSIVDTLALATIPSTLLNGFLNRWVLGVVFCRVSFVVESVNKVLTTFIMTGLAADRYLAVCGEGGRMGGFRSTTGAGIFLAVSVVLASALLCPVALFTGLKRDLRGHSYCLTDWPETPFWPDGWLGLLFGIGFLLPASLISFFYLRVLAKLAAHKRESMVQSQICLRRVTRSSLLIVLCYYLCWTPFWTYQIIIFAAGDMISISHEKALFVCGRLVTLLPFLQASLNWIAYAFFNSAIRQASISSPSQPSTKTDIPLLRPLLP